MRTGLLVNVNNIQYHFNMPDGFQRVAAAQNVSFIKSRYVFLSQLTPDCFSGFPGFYLSARESGNSRESDKDIKKQKKMED